MYKIFDESPSRRADSERITSATSSDYPLRFSSHRWIENAKAVKRTQIIWSNIVHVVKFWKGLPKSKQPAEVWLILQFHWNCDSSKKLQHLWIKFWLTSRRITLWFRLRLKHLTMFCEIYVIILRWEMSF